MADIDVALDIAFSTVVYQIKFFSVSKNYCFGMWKTLIYVFNLFCLGWSMELEGQVIFLQSSLKLQGLAFWTNLLIQ